MHILRTNIDEIELRHLDELVAARTRESEALEFKATLPFQPQKGQPQQSDRWIEQGDRIGDYARDQILSEMVAFANANGGTLVLGVVESDEQPREAVGLSPLPNCEALAQRLMDAAEDIIEPRLLSLMTRGLPMDAEGNGYVVLRVGRSHAGPHRLNGKAREFYVRRGERAARMDVREIKSLTLELARSGDRVQAVFDSRRQAAHNRFHALPRPSDGELPALLLRASAFPTLALEIEGLTAKRELWWQGGAFNLQFAGEAVECSYPAREFSNVPELRLRSLVNAGGNLDRVVRGDGLIEAVLAVQPRSVQRGTTDGRLYIGWIAGLVVGTLAQVEHLRQRIGWDVVEFGLEIEVWSFDQIHLLWYDGDLSEGVSRARPNTMPLRFPLYSVRQAATFDDLLNQFMQDLFNAWGSRWSEPCTVDWGKLIQR